MAGPRGYSSYRGRGPKSRILLAIVLALVILAAVGYILIQRFLVYDDSGVAHLKLPAAPQTEEPLEVPEVDLIIQEPAKPAALHARLLAQMPITAAAVADIEPDGAVAVTLKSTEGTVFYPSAAAAVGTVETAADTEAALRAVTGGSGPAIARISCFLDPKAADDVEGKGLKNTGGFIFYDGNNARWLDPAKPNARAYLTALIEEAAALGFDEILLMEVSYPTEGKLDKIAYGDVDRTEQLTAFLQQVRKALTAYPEVSLSLELPAHVITAGADAVSGQSLAAMAPLVSRIYAETDGGIQMAQTLSAAVTAANGATEFVPEVIQQPAEDGSYLLLPES